MAYLVAFQTVFAGMPAPAAASALAPVLCSHDSGGGPQDRHDHPGPDQAAACCVPGCGMPIAHAGPPPGGASIVAPSTIRVEVRLPATAAAKSRRPELSPCRSRAPPEPI